MSKETKLEAIREWVEQRLGIVYPKDEESTLSSRVESLCTQQQMTTSGVWSRLQVGDVAVEARLAEVVSTNHTLFFREPDAFQVLRDEIYPTLPTHQELRLWSAAASSGEEAYSIAITMRQIMGSLAEHRVKILGTDISEQQLKLADRALYPKRSLPTLSPEQRMFFLSQGEDLRPLPEITAMCSFRRLNLVQTPWPFQQRFHVIFLRNVLYYFSPALRETVLEACFDATEPGGWLLTSTTEPMINLKTRWSLQRPGLYRKDRWL